MSKASNQTVMVQRLTSSDPNFKKTLLASLSLPSADDQAIDAVVIAILAEVKSRGDEALLSYTKQFDRLSANHVSDLEIKQAELEAAYRSLPTEQAKALEIAAQRVRAYHEKQKEAAGCRSWEYTEPDGTRLGQKVTPLDRVGIYVPGGRRPIHHLF